MLMMSSLSERAAAGTAAAAAATMRAPTSLDVVNIYPPAIIAAPSGLGAAACRVNRGWRWEINEQCASGASNGTSGAQSSDTYLRKKVTEVSDGHLAAICEWQLSPDVPLSSEPSGTAERMK